jgi:protein TonB
MRPPKYPPQAARTSHRQVILRVLIGTDGSPKDVTVEKSSGYRELDQSAVRQQKRGCSILEGTVSRTRVMP